jgi:hypothetical protein
MIRIDVMLCAVSKHRKSLNNISAKRTAWKLKRKLQFNRTYLKIDSLISWQIRDNVIQMYKVRKNYTLLNTALT